MPPVSRSHGGHHTLAYYTLPGALATSSCSVTPRSSPSRTPTAPARFELATLKLTASCTAVVLQGKDGSFQIQWVIEESGLPNLINHSGSYEAAVERNDVVSICCSVPSSVILVTPCRNQDTPSNGSVGNRTPVQNALEYHLLDKRNVGFEPTTFRLET